MKTLNSPRKARKSVKKPEYTNMAALNLKAVKAFEIWWAVFAQAEYKKSPAMGMRYMRCWVAGYGNGYMDKADEQKASEDRKLKKELKQ